MSVNITGLMLDNGQIAFRHKMAAEKALQSPAAFRLPDAPQRQPFRDRKAI